MTICWTVILLVVLRAGVEGPRLHRPESWLVRQLSDEPKPVYKVGFIRERKGHSQGTAAEPGGRWLTAQVKAGAFMDVLTLG
jgi:hypothetical protein